MKLSKILKDKYFLALIACILLAAIFTFRYLLSQTIFGYDMARDAFHAYDIFYHHNLKILGPGTDIVGLNHGVVWYYVLAIPYFVAQQDPQVAVIFFFFFAIFTIPIVWLLAQELFKNRTVSFISTILYSFSPLVVPISSWMSNPILCLYFAPPLLLLILKYSRRQNSKKAFFIGILYGLLIQSQLANILLLLSIPFFVIILKLKFRLKDLLSFIFGFLIMMLSFILVEVKFKGRGVEALFEYLHKGHGGHIPRNDFIIGKFIEYFQLTVFPFSDKIVSILAIVVAIGIIFAFRAKKREILFLLVWLFNIFLFALFDTGVSHSYFVFIPSVAAGIILFSYLVVKFLKFRIVIAFLVILLVFFQVRTIEKWKSEDYSPAAIQKSNTILRYKQVIDYTYTASEGQPFIINTLTNPLYINTVWEYLYGFYGYKKYGYKPYFGGRSQEGYQHLLTNKHLGTNMRFLILESSIGMDAIYPVKANYDEDKISDIVEEKKFGLVTVQKRVYHENKDPIEIPPILMNSQVLYE